MKLLVIFQFHANSEMWLISLSGLFMGSMGLMWTMKGGLCGMSSPGSITGEKYLGVWEGISILFDFHQNI